MHAEPANPTEQANQTEQTNQAPVSAADQTPTTPTDQTSQTGWASAHDSLSWANTPAAAPQTTPIEQTPTDQTTNLPQSQPVTGAPGISGAAGWDAQSQTMQPAPQFSSATYAPYAPYPGAAPQPGMYAPYPTYAPPVAPGMGGRPPIRTSGPIASPNGAPPATATLTAPPAGRRGPIVAIGAAALIALLVVALLAFALGRVSGGAPSTGSTTSGPTITTTSSTTASSANVASAASVQQAIVSVVNKVQPSVVEVTSVNGQGEAIGSGDILNSNGYIVTNDHVVNGFTSYTVTLSTGKHYTAQLVGADAQDDLAVLKINATNLPAISIAGASAAQVGDFAIAIGSPLGLQNSSTLGIVSALNRSESEGSGGVTSVLTGLTQTSAPINPGNSGGALVNLDGQLIGIPTLGASSTSSGETVTGIGFAIPSSRVVYVVNQLIANGKLTHTNQGFLGVQGQDVTPSASAAQGGVQVAGFANDATGQSPAQQGGVQSGDIITAVNGQPVTSQTDLAGAVFEQAPGAKVTLTVLRGSGTTTLTVTLGERPVGA